MNTKKLFGFGILAFVGGGAYYFYRQVNLFKQMVVKIVNAKPKSVSTSAVEVEFEVQINNISNIDAYITGLNFDIIVENQLVATISKSFDPNKIVEKGGVAFIKLETTFDPSKILAGSIIGLLDNLWSGSAFNINVRGKLNGGSKFFKLADYPINENISVVG
tara:strand:+ start:1159 stop:1644 length:486 start_codon:yes stop_codon:yes gene_type:complete